jgi:hypothetical protein
MYPACILITLADTCIPHVSRMYAACILHIRYVPLKIHLRYMYLIMYLGAPCVLDRRVRAAHFSDEFWPFGACDNSMTTGPVNHMLKRFSSDGGGAQGAGACTRASPVYHQFSLVAVRAKPKGPREGSMEGSGEAARYRRTFLRGGDGSPPSSTCTVLRPQGTGPLPYTRHDITRSPVSHSWLHPAPFR